MAGHLQQRLARTGERSQLRAGPRPTAHAAPQNFKSYRGHSSIGPFHNFTTIIGPNGSGESMSNLSCTGQRASPPAPWGRSTPLAWEGMSSLNAMLKRGGAAPR